jgi:hypothetical protein
MVRIAQRNRESYCCVHMMCDPIGTGLISVGAVAVCHALCVCIVGFCSCCGCDARHMSI